MQDITYENLVEKVSNIFPKYLDTDFFKFTDGTLNYPFFSGLIQYIISNINQSNNPEEDQEIIKAFQLLNSMIDKGGKLENLAVVEGIEWLLQEKKSKELAIKLLNEKGQHWLKEVYKTTGVRGESKLKSFLKKIFK